MKTPKRKNNVKIRKLLKEELRLIRGGDVFAKDKDFD
jgi:hypothetical protein